MLNRLLLFVFLSIAFINCSKAAVVDSLVHQFSLSKTQLDSLLNANGIPPAFVGTIYDIEVYKVIYNTVGLDSLPTYASGLLAFPSNANCRLPLTSYGHGTMSRREDAPSRGTGLESVIGMILASVGYVATLPDYLGLGDAPAGLLHPYQDARTEASASIDLLRATRELAPQLNFRLNDQLFLAGYSQGGHTTMATHRAIQNELNGEFTVTASCPMSGPYDLSGVMVDVMLSDSDYAVPGYLPYLAFGWNQRYQFYSSPSEYLRSPYDTILPPLFDGTHGMGEINNAMPSVPKLIFKQEMLDSFTSNLNHPFRQALKDNDVYDWKPDSAVRIVFCRADEEVTWHNAITLYNTFKANNAASVDTVCASETLPHFQCAQVAILGMRGFFGPRTVLDSCVTVSVEDIERTTFSIYPNPATSTLTLAYKDETYFEDIFAVNALGQSSALTFTQATYQTQVNIQSLAGGMYYLLAKSNGKDIPLGRFLKQ